MSQPTQPVWEKRPNMGASPIAIQAAEAVLKDLGGHPNYRGIIIAAHVDAVFRKAKVPELHKALENLLWAINTSKRPVPLEPALATAVVDARAALNLTQRDLDLSEPYRGNYCGH